jgi:hypothetical protein
MQRQRQLNCPLRRTSAAGEIFSGAGWAACRPGTIDARVSGLGARAQWVVARPTSLPVPYFHMAGADRSDMIFGKHTISFAPDAKKSRRREFDDSSTGFRKAAARIRDILDRSGMLEASGVWALLPHGTRLREQQDHTCRL